MPRRRAALAAAAIVVIGGGAACSTASPKPAAQLLNGPVRGHGQLAGTSIGDVIGRPALRLPDTAGKPFDLRTRPKGRVTLLFFGYTHCPDVCPTTMADLAAGLRRLEPAQRQNVEVVFVTEDPSRDLPPILRSWLDTFDTTFVGLIGGGDRTAPTLRALKAPLSAVPRDGTVQHAGSVYAFSGSEVVVYTGGTTPAQYAGDLRLLMGHAT